MKSPLSATVLLVADTAAVRQFWPALVTSAHHVRAPHRWVASVGTDRVILLLAEAAVWLVTVWLGIGLLAALCGALPGAAGRTADLLARRVLPRALYRLCAGAIGIGVLVAPIAAQTAAVAAGRPPALAEAAAVAGRPPPSWPTGGPIPPPTWPQGSDAPDAPRATPGAPTPAPPHAVPPAGQAPTGPSTGAAVTVRPGDSLWLIAARRLGGGASPAQIEVLWREWYTANRALIGADPDLIHPGQVLVDPGGRSASAPSTEEAR